MDERSEVRVSSSLHVLVCVGRAFMSHLADGSFILIQIFPELLQLQISFPQLLLQLPHHSFVAFHGWWRVATGPAVRQGLPAPT